MKRICALAVAIMLALCCGAFAETGIFTYLLTDGEVYITGYTGSEAVISIPDEIEGSPVTTIVGGAFLNMPTLTEVTLPASVTYIGDCAFMGCASLRSISIESTRYKLGKMVFKGCDRGLVITAREGTTAQTYAEDAGIAFIPLSLDEGDIYAQALADLEAGDLETALALFAGLDRYEDSRDYYIYATARIYERDGATDKAIALYLIVPETLDAMDRLTALQKAEPAAGGVVIGGMIGGKLKPEATEAPAAEAPIVGGKLGSKATEAPTVIETPALAPTELISFHEFIGGMPYSFDDYSKEEGMYTLYYYIDDFAQLDGYRALFIDAGWTEIDEGMDGDGWSYVYVTAPDGVTSFYIAYIESEELVVFMYDSSADYGFDPLKGL